MKKIVTIIIVHWNTPELLRKQLQLLYQSEFEIVVIDNASRKSISWIKKEFPRVRLIENKINRGFAFACNQGIVNGIGEWFLFLNPDVEITPKQIEKMIEYAEINKLVACSPVTSSDYQKPLPSWLSLLIEFTLLNKLKRFLATLGMTSGGDKTLFGGCLLIRSEIIKSLGGFDERFFLWFEDSDLTQRLINEGYKTGWTNLSIKHKGGASFNSFTDQTKKDIFFHSMDVYAKKHFSFFGKFIVKLIKNKYSKRKLLPQISEKTDITIPNLKSDLLELFFKNNTLHNSEVNWIVVTSSIKSADIWKWRKKYPEVRFIPIEKNKGFASTVNIGFRVSTGKWLGTVNDDVVLSQTWLINCLKSSNEKSGSINPIIYKQNQEIESAGIKILLKGKAIPIITLHYYSHGRTLNNVKYIETDAANAACVIYSSDALNKVGLFDEKFGSYLEDVDLSLRLKRTGYENIVALNSKVTHISQSSSKDLGTKKQFYDFRNWIYVILKNWSAKDLLLNFPEIFIERLRNISGLLKALVIDSTD